jgi:RNA polymerase sigma factor for flagellar operon FliA
MVALAPNTDRQTGSRDELIEQHLQFAKSQSHRLHKRLPSHVDVEELESDAYPGLLKAARTFDPERGVQFRTCAAKRIFGAMLDGIRPARTMPGSYSPVTFSPLVLQIAPLSQPS